MGTTAPERLVERRWELDALREACDRLGGGQGGVLVVEGPPGIGKTSLLDELRGEAQNGAGARVLRARCSELEQTFAHGVTRQLLERAARERGDGLSGAAALALPVLGIGDGIRDDAGDADFAALHALYWLIADLAAGAPLLLAIDDAQWADRRSARFVQFLVNRVDEHPVLIALTVRRTGADGERRGLARLGALRESVVLEPRPLGRDGVAAALETRLGRRPAAAFTSAVHARVGGNPLLVDQLALQLRRNGIEPTEAGVVRLAEVDATSVARDVLVRLAALGDTEQQVARAVAVLGGGASPARAAVVVGVPPTDALAAIARLESADVLEPETLEFAHAIVRDAVLQDMAPAARSSAHTRAAHVLADDGATAEEAAAHLLHSSGERDRRSFALLRTAAENAQRRGAPESAQRYLERALAEPPPPSERADVLAALGQAATRAGDPAARDHLRAAADLATGAARIRALTRLGHASLAAGDLDGAAAAFLDAATTEGGREERLRAEAELASALINSRRFDEALRRLAQYADVPGDTPGERMLLAVAAFASAQSADPAERTIALAGRALSGGRLLEEQTASSLLVAGVAWALLFADALAEAEVLLDAAVDEARTRGAVPGFALATFGRAWLLLRRGDLAGARADAESSFGTRDLYRWHATGPLAAALIVESLVDEGDLSAAADFIAEAGLDRDLPDVAIFNLLLYARGRLKIARGDSDDGIEEVLMAGHREVAVGGRAPGGIPWRSTAAEALSQSDPDRARALADEGVELARRVRAPRAIGVAVRAAGVARDGDEALDLLRESVDVLGSCDARIELARAQLALGTALRRSGARSDARESLRAALDNASRCGARPLAERARQELAAGGARPRNEQRSGVAALTPTELRIARMAAEGRSNPQIAQDLFVTRKTVEFHLSNAYRKLRIASRLELAGALGDA